MIEALITSKTRVKILLKFFLNPGTSAYLRGLESEFGESSNAIRLELNRFEEAGLLTSYANGNKKIFKANEEYPLFTEINSMVRKILGIDQIISKVLHKLGDLECAYLTGNLAKGIDDDVIDLVFVGNINRAYLSTLVVRCEENIQRKIRYLVYTREEFRQNPGITENGLLLWKKMQAEH